MKLLKLLNLIGLLSLLSACSGIPEKWGGTKSLDLGPQITGKTLNYSMKWVDEATVKVLDQMEIIVIEKDSNPNGQTIKAATLDLDINIELQPVSESSTHMKIDITSSGKPKGNQTGIEIIDQTQTYLIDEETVEKLDVADQLKIPHNIFPAK